MGFTDMVKYTCTRLYYSFLEVYKYILVKYNATAC